MTWFHDLPVGRKLAVAFAVTTLMTFALGMLALWRLGISNVQIQDTNRNWLPAVLHLGQMRALTNEIRLYELALLDPQRPQDQRREYRARLDKDLQAIAEAERAYDAIPAESSAREQAMYDEVRTARQAYLAANAAILAALERGDFADASRISDSDALQHRRDLSDALDALTAYNAEHLHRQVAGSETSYRSTVAVIWIGIAILLLSASLFGWRISRAIARPLQQANRVARDIAQGRLDNPIGAQRRDETGQLLESMRCMQQQLQAVIAAQTEMTVRHDQGQISFRIDDASFPGEYGRMVRDTNALVAQHIGVKMRAVETMRRYAVGDLSVDMDRLPGEKAAITDAMDMCKQALSSINGEIRRLSAAAAAGDFSVRGDESAYRHDFLAMVQSLNGMMASSDQTLSQLSQLLRAIAAGDLTARMEGDFRGVFATMRDDANITVEQLTAIVGRIQQSNVAINSAAAEIAAGNEDLSRRTEQQAANLEETAASMEELTSTVKQNAEHARQANQLVIGATSVASQGGDVVGQVVATMTDIQASSRRIGDIISVIDGIAFQTNILALNAAVEAARAGELGRGFAVVASEVRSLAQRSATAAREIKTLIEESTGRVESGSALALQAGATMTEIVASVRRVTDIMGEIAAASQEQASGIEQVSQTIVQMDGATQQNAALVEEASAAARAMEDQASGLASAVAVFRLEPRAPHPGGVRGAGAGERRGRRPLYAVETA
ncbi:methyl-accepting chemotaxis protein [Xanthomonas sp. XNM01]|uniref:methyl-accepting chemotaxis protein n=1 Tax=Xanthomonas sp. XNM01 TaxID=2769289 RepID=UPI00177AF239|nr:methyl-accepting chemotaxis protein [Xanthomonas sp. XNM01]MBD9368266.1 MCP four helix bundle domain-containing protein [Xanthomonas sp. XNM01]